MMSRVLLLVPAALIVAACGAAPERVSYVEFSIEGTDYRIEDAALLVRANPRVFDGQTIKRIEPEGDHTFGFYLDRPATPDSPDGLVDIQWFLRTSDPQAVLDGPIKTAGAGGTALAVYLLIQAPGVSLSNEQRGDHTAWVAVDEVRNGWARGRLGGQVQAVRPDPETGVSAALVDIEDGSFHVPYEELFLFR